MSGVILLFLRLLFTAALYIFLGGILLILWRDLTRQRQISTARSVPLALQVGDGLPIRYFSSPVVIVGRDPICDLHLDDPTVSAQHARFSYHHNQWWLEDLHSRNGTLLNDELVVTATVITQGDEIRFGGVFLCVGENDL